MDLTSTSLNTTSFVEEDKNEDVIFRAKNVSIFDGNGGNKVSFPILLFNSLLFGSVTFWRSNIADDKCSFIVF